MLRSGPTGLTPRPAEVFGAGDDYILCNGIRPHTPRNMADGQPCESCGFAVGEQVVRRRAVIDRDGSEVIPPRVGRVICLESQVAVSRLVGTLHGLALTRILTRLGSSNTRMQEQEGEKKRRPSISPARSKGGQGQQKKGMAK